jgi:transcriptional regulator with XRE-family HTH domain
VKDFATDIRALRKARGLSQAAAAVLLGRTAVTIWNWEKGRSTPWSKDRAAILLKLGERHANVARRKRLIDNVGEC